MTLATANFRFWHGLFALGAVGTDLNPAGQEEDAAPDFGNQIEIGASVGTDDTGNRAGFT